MIKAALAQGIDIGTQFNPPFGSFGELVSVLLPNVFTIAGIIFFILLIGGGFGIILNAGKGRKEGVARGQKAVTAALIGFLIIIGSYWIIQIISAVTGVDILS